MNEAEIIKLIKSKSEAIDENLLLSTELKKIKEIIENFLDQNLQDNDILSLRYRKFKLSGRSRTLWSDTNGFPVEGKKFIQPYIDLFDQYIARKTIVNRLEEENLWVESRVQNNEQHLFIGDKQNKEEKVHLIFGETGEIRIDKKDQFPGEILRRVESILTKPDGNVVKSTLEFLRLIGDERYFEITGQ